MADDLIHTVGSFIGVPCRLWLRRHHSIVSSFNEVPVYVVRCKEDIHLGLERFVKGADWLGRVSPIWLRRMPMLLGSIMLLDTIDTFETIRSQVTRG